MEGDDEVLKNNEALPSGKFAVPASALSRFEYVMIGERPCKIVELKHRKLSARPEATIIHLLGVDIFDGSKETLELGSDQQVWVPQVIREEYEVIDLIDSNFSLMDRQGVLRDDLELTKSCNPDDSETVRELLEDTNAGGHCIATVLTVLGKVVVVEVKHAKDGLGHGVLVVPPVKC